MQAEFVQSGVPARAPSGFVLIDSTLHVIHCNSVALEIFGYPDMGRAQDKLHSFILGTLGPLIRDAASRELNWVTEFVSGRRQYCCRAYSLAPGESAFSDQHIALVFERSASIMGGLPEISKRFSLSPRESQVLRLALRGCCNKEMANELELSPNTVKTFIRMVMVKMGVTTRARVVCKALNCLEELHQRELSDELSHELHLVQAQDSVATARLVPASAISARMAPRPKKIESDDDLPDAPLVRGPEIVNVATGAHKANGNGNGNGNGNHAPGSPVLVKPKPAVTDDLAHEPGDNGKGPLLAQNAVPVAAYSEVEQFWRGRFTPKERKILALVAQGCTSEEIASELRAPEKTVRNYLRALLCTTGLSELSELGEFTLTHRLLDPPAKEY